ncbi:MAG: DUF2461 domain-containing protein [Bacteroidetes bacterium]|nr:DUF2461 domain-containing protein [Bacteroidota bacterium]
MIQPSVLKFLKDLSRNNNKPWFDAHRKEYENAKTAFHDSLTKVIKGIAGFDKPIGLLQAKDCTFRINRDVRFSKNKDPYKNNMGGYFNKDGKKGRGAGYYMHVQPGESFIAGGIWMPEPDVLAKIRQEIDYNFDEWKKITGTASFRNNFPKAFESGEKLSRPPKGYEPDNPAIHFIKMKSYVITRSFSDKEITSAGFEQEVVKTFKVMKPVIDFINRSID